MRDAADTSMSSDDWSETMTQLFETVQWRVRPAVVLMRPPLWPSLPVPMDPIIVEEVSRAVLNFRRNCAVVEDAIPAEFLECIIQDRHGMEWITKLCNECWSSLCVPRDCQSGHVSMLC